ncbi:unnamed protein product, partial [Meganyctiphanes norvegica]
RKLKTLILACECEVSNAINDVQEDPNFAAGQKRFIKCLVAIYDRSPGDYLCVQPGGCPGLVKLVLPRMDDEDGDLADHMTKALANLSKLEELTGIPMLNSLAQLQANPDPPETLKLKQLNDIDTYNRRNMPDMENLTKILSNVKGIELFVSPNITKAFVERFKEVNFLKIELADFHIHISSFRSLSTLDIGLDFECAWPLVAALSRCRLQIQDLTLRNSTFKLGQGTEGTRPRIPSLQAVTLIKPSFIEGAAMRTLVGGCPNLCTIWITLSDDRNYCVDEFTDNLISDIAPHLSNLESFTAECQYKYNLYNELNCLLTMDAISLLLEHCPKLQTLGQLDCWNITDSDFTQLSLQVKIHNWDLKLLQGYEIS